LCDDDIPCTDDVCDVSLGRCTNVPNDNNCPVNDKCDIYTCNPKSGDDNGCVGTPIVCDDDIPCTDDYCDSADGLCKYPTNDTNCDDGNVAILRPL
jgi:hypothetical protein